MNAGVLCDTLQSFWWWQLRDVAAEMGIASKGSRASLIARICAMGTDPVCGIRVSQAMAHAQRECKRRGKKRRRAELDPDNPARNLETAFECAALQEEEGTLSPTASPLMIYYPESMLPPLPHSVVAN